MYRAISILLWVSSILVVAQARNKDLLDDELLKKIMHEMNIEEEQARNLIGIEADGSLGSKCDLFEECNTGFECFHRRCIPNRDCMKEQIEDFNASFDSEGYQKLMYQTTGVTEEDLKLAFQESGGDQVAFAESPAMLSLIEYMQENSEPFEPVADIVGSCSGIVSGRRLKIEKTTVRTGETNKQRRLQTSTPSSSPSSAPSVSRTATQYIGIHIEGGAVFEVSLTVAFRLGSSTADNFFIRGCFGAELGGGFETSFYLALAFDGLDEGWGCGSVLFDQDAGLGLNLGAGLGICFARTDTVYLEFTMGAGIGAGFGFNICGTIVRPRTAPQ